MKTEFMLPPANWKNLTFHPLSEVVAFGVGIDVDALAAHITEHGYDEQEAIVLVRHDKIDVVLDGRHKLRACIIADVTPSFRRYVGANAEAYVAKKAFRQHLNTSQRAMIAAAIANHPSGVLGKNDKSANLQTSAEAAKALNISPRAVADAKTVLAKGTQALQAAVEDDTISVSDAAKVADETAKVQNEAVKKVRDGKAKTARSAAKSLTEEIDASLAEPEEDKPDPTVEEIMAQKSSELESFCRGLMKYVEENMPEDEWLDYMGRGDGAKQKIKDACSAVRSAKCTHVCPMCKGDRCKKCEKTGRVPFYVYQQLCR
jgi:excinuclease UvrABC ATPase subunit